MNTKSIAMLLLLTIMGCSLQISDKLRQEVKDKLIQTDWNGRQLVFTEERLRKMGSGYETNPSGYQLWSYSGNKQYSYDELVNKKGIIVGLIDDTYFKTWIIEIENGDYLKSMNMINTVSNGQIKYTYFVDSLDSLKSTMTGKHIWLNHISIGKPTDSDYEVFVHKDLRVPNRSQIQFNRYDKVEIIDVIPFNIYPSYDTPFYLKIKSSSGEIGFIQYFKNNNDQPLLYFLNDPSLE